MSDKDWEIGRKQALMGILQHCCMSLGYDDPEVQKRAWILEREGALVALRNICNVTVVSPIPWFPKFRLFGIFKKWHKFSRIPGKYNHKEIEVISPKYIAIPKLGFLHSFTLFISVRLLLRI